MDAPTVGIGFIDYFLALLADHGYLVTFGFAFVENIFIVGSIVPGETIQVAAGFVSSSGAINPFIVWMVAFAGSFIGGNVSYFVGRRGGRPLLQRIMRTMHIKEDRLLATEAYFDQHGRKTIFLARWVAGVKNLAPAVAGMSKMNVAVFELYSLLGALFYTSMLVIGGYFFGEYLDVVLDVVKGSAWGALLVVLAVVAYTRYRLWRRGKNKDLAEEATHQFPAVQAADAEADGPEA